MALAAGAAFIDIFPTLQGVTAQTKQQLVKPLQAAGLDAGREAAIGIDKGVQAGAEKAGKEGAKKLGGGLKTGFAAGIGMVGLGAGAGASLLAGLSGAIDGQALSAHLGAELGLSTKESGRLGRIAGDLYADNYGDSLEQVHEAIGSVIQNVRGMRHASDSELKAISGDVLNVAGTFDQDLGGVTRAVGQLMRTGLAKNAHQALDIVTAGFQGGVNKADDFLDTLNEYGTQFRKLGLNGKVATGLLRQGLQGGARDADVVADSLKEFSIRAVDGSKTTGQGFKALGLDGQLMAQRIAKGGKSASGALDLTLQRLRRVKDPVKQSQIAVKLFGTQAEDLGKSLYSLDPSTAVKGLGRVGGAAKRMGDTLAETDQSRITTFIRSVQQGFVAVIGGKVLPVVSRFLGVVSEHQASFTVLGAGLAIAAAAFLAVSAAGTVASSVMAIYESRQIAVSIATKLAAAGQWLLNAAMAANPIGIVLVLIGLLIAGIVLLWRHSATFRSIVMAAWGGIKTAVAATWGVLRMVFTAIGGFLTRTLGPVFLWLWHTVIQPVWAGIALAARIGWAILRIIFAAVRFYIAHVLAPAFLFLWHYVVKPVFSGIALAVRIAWAILRVIFAVLVFIVRRVLAAAFLFLWHGVIKPVWAGIRVIIAGAWIVLHAIFLGIVAVVRHVLAPVFMWLWRNVIRPVWEGIKTVISAVWRGGIKPVLMALATFVKTTVAPAFRRGVDMIKSAWSSIKEAAKKPVNFLISTVYGRGIKGTFDALAKAVQSDVRLPVVKPLAAGGPVPAATVGWTNRPTAVVGEGGRHPEVVIPTDPKYRSRALGLYEALGGQLLAKGGILGSITGGVGDLAGWFSHPVRSFKAGLAGPAAGLKAYADSDLGRIVGALPGYIASTLASKIGSLFGISGGGAGYAAALAFAKGHTTSPYVWGGVGPGGWDCSGWLSTLENIVEGVGNIFSRRFISDSFSGAARVGNWIKGLRSPFMLGALPGSHVAGTLLGVNVESSGSRGPHYGPSARGAFDGMFTQHYGLAFSGARRSPSRKPAGAEGAMFDGGGWMQPHSWGYNGLSSPEPVFTPGQWKTMRRTAQNGGGGLRDITVMVGNEALDPRMYRVAVTAVDDLAEAADRGVRDT